MNFNPCVEIPLFDPLDELIRNLAGRLYKGSFWTRAEHYQGKRYDLHFTVLNVAEDVGESKILVHDGNFAGRIMTLRQFEVHQQIARFELVTYWPVMEDELDRVKFSTPR